MGGGDISKVEKTMAKKFGMKPINKEKLLQKKGKGSPSLGGRSSSQRQRPSSARVRKVKPLVGGGGGSMTTDGNEDGEDISIISTKVSQGDGSRRRHGKRRPQSAAPSRRSAKSTSGRMRPSSSTGKRKSKKSQGGGGGGSGGSGGKSTKTKAPDMSIESIRARHNEQLLRVLEQEQEQEERRERILRGIKVCFLVLVVFVLAFRSFVLSFFILSDALLSLLFYFSSLHFTFLPFRTKRRGEDLIVCLV